MDNSTIDYSTLSHEELVELLSNQRKNSYKYIKKYHNTDKGKLAKSRASRKYYQKKKAMSAL
jgi:hypothetical protein